MSIAFMIQLWISVIEMEKEYSDSMGNDIILYKAYLIKGRVLSYFIYSITT